MKPWFLYILRCADGSLYTGITTDVERRLKEHVGKKGAKYLRPSSRHPFQVVFVSQAGNDRPTALKVECRVKSLRKWQKEELVDRYERQGNLSLMEVFDVG